MNNAIGIIDSGIGGLSVWKEIVRLLPEESTIYLADSQNLPYGDKSEEEIYKLAKPLMMHLIDKDVKLIVIACNTITVSALERFRKDFPSLPIVATVPVVKTAATVSKSKRIGILATKRTAESEYQQRLITQFAPDCEVINVGTNKLVPMVESGDVDTTILKTELQPLVKGNIDTLALGCTHFPFLQEQIQEVVGADVQILDSAEAVARQVRLILQREDIETDGVLGSHGFYTTGDEEQLKEQIKRLIGEQRGKIQQVEI